MLSFFYFLPRLLSAVWRIHSASTTADGDNGVHRGCPDVSRVRGRPIRDPNLTWASMDSS